MKVVRLKSFSWIHIYLRNQPWLKKWPGDKWQHAISVTNADIGICCKCEAPGLNESNKTD